MLFEEPVLIAGDGARAFAAEAGVPLCDPDELIPSKPGKQDEEETHHDTVGCVALDVGGHLAVAVSTGGLDGVYPGRVGDSPQPGCGFYCDDKVGGVVFSGDGEQIARMMLAARVMHALDHLQPDDAMRAALEHLKWVGGEAGGIILTPEGTFGWFHNSDTFAVGYASSVDPLPKVYLTKAEEQHG
jgi:beta-aspartyl-peptidase (threonine type)